MLCSVIPRGNCRKSSAGDRRPRLRRAASLDRTRRYSPGTTDQLSHCGITPGRSVCSWAGSSAIACGSALSLSARSRTSGGPAAFRPPATPEISGSCCAEISSWRPTHRCSKKSRTPAVPQTAQPPARPRPALLSLEGVLRRLTREIRSRPPTERLANISGMQPAREPRL